MTPDFKEAPISQIPTLRFLQQLGYSYLSPEETAVERKGKLGRVLLRVSARCWRVAQANRAHYPARLLRDSIDRAHGRRWACISVEDWIVWHVHFVRPSAGIDLGRN